MGTEIQVKTTAHSQAVNITDQVRRVVADADVWEGWCVVHVFHTTAGVAVNEAADPAVMSDVLAALDRMVPWKGPYAHAEGNSAAHMKSILVGSTLHLPVSEGQLRLGTWQGVFFMEFDGPRTRRVLVDVVPN